MNSEYILIIIDVQPRFNLYQDKEDMIFSIQQEIKKTMRDEQDILYIEYRGTSETEKSYFTEQELTDLTKDYNKTHFVLKQRCDGSYKILDYLKQNNLSPKQLKICGVYTNVCVMDTVCGLVNKRNNIELLVLENSCKAECPEDHNFGIEAMEKVVTIVRSDYV